MFTSSDSAGPSACPQSYTVRKIPLSAASSQLPHWSLEGGGAVRLSIQSAKTRRGADCGSDHDLLIAKFRLKLNKVGKTTRPFRYELNQIPYDYTVEVINRFKGLDFVG